MSQTENKYSSVSIWTGKNLISGNITWLQITSSKKTAKYADEVLAYINEQGYTINKDNKCIRISELN